jgi:hypothetical protein
VRSLYGRFAYSSPDQRIAQVIEIDSHQPRLLFDKARRRGLPSRAPALIKRHDRLVAASLADRKIEKGTGCCTKLKRRTPQL